ncbi:MAG: hypothetical protein O3B09_04135 [Proteobacteria bacterium]|nr:hypothetical protein [Pseudomonadota bacterium]
MTIHILRQPKEKQVNQLPREATKLVELLDNIEEFTIYISKKIMSELSYKGNEPLHIKLYDTKK